MQAGVTEGVKEENYFFQLSKFEKAAVTITSSIRDFIQPGSAP